MKRKNLTALCVILGCLIVLALLCGLIFSGKSGLFHKGQNPAETQKNPAESTQPDVGNTGNIKTFSCITVTVGKNPATDVNITWNSLESENGYVEISDNNFAEGSIIKVDAIAESTTFQIPAEGQFDYKAPVLNEVSGSIFRAYITGLTPGKTYNYRVGDGKKYSENYTFTTASDDNNYSFLLISDTQGFTKRNFDVFGNVIKTATASHPDANLIVHMGDAVEEGKNLYQWQTYFDSASGIMENHTVVNVVGNKDKKHTLAHYTCGAQENRTALVSGYYSFEIGSVHFAVLNTGDGDKDIPKSQLKWLESDLAAANDKHVIILIHKAPYSDANHCNDAEILAIRSQIMPIATKYNVPLVIEGHDHYYFRSKPVSCVENFGNLNISENTENGTIYFMNGSAGCRQHDGNVLSPEGVLTAKSEILTSPTYSYVTVTDNRIDFKTYYVNTTGSETLLEAFGIEW